MTHPEPVPPLAWSDAPIHVVGIGADGWVGLPVRSQEALADRTVLLGSTRQLRMLPTDLAVPQIPWPAPLLAALPELLTRHRHERIGVLASGDPMFYGIGNTLAQSVGPRALRVFPQVSSASLACARLGWSLANVPCFSAVGRPLAALVPELTHGRRILVLSADADTPSQLAHLLQAHGLGDSRLTVLEQLGGPHERIWDCTARQWDEPQVDPLNILAVEVVVPVELPRGTRIPGRPDKLYGTGGQLTKSEVRALTLSALAPAPGEVLWDIGGGSGSIAIEWCRTHPTCRAVTFEKRASRRERITDNATRLGVPGVVVGAEFPAAATQPSAAPDAVFIGGGLTAGVFAPAWAQLRPGGRLVANAVTAESEAELLNLARSHGGHLRKYQIYRAGKLGGLTAWRPQLPVTQWSVTKQSPN